MIELIVQYFPLVALLVILLVVVLSFRLQRRLGRSAYSAGPPELDQPIPPGQEPSPWELQAIQSQLHALAATGSSVVRRYDLTATVNRLTFSAGLIDPHHQLPITANEAELATAITKIEDQLGLPPLSEGIDES